MRLRRSKPDRPGYGRRRSGKGFSYLDTSGEPLKDAAAVERIKALVIPPAWQDVWISPDERGHIQATGVDAAGRKQYQYHPQWRTDRDGKKFDHVLEVAARLPRVRDRVREDLTTGRGLSRGRVLAAIIGLLDLGEYRIGGDASIDNEAFGLSTLRPEHVDTSGPCAVLEFTGKSGVEHRNTVGDGEVCAVLKELKKRRRGKSRLFAYWQGRAWHEVHAGEINEYLREISGTEMSAKDFRTWQGTVKAAKELAAAGPKETKTARKKAVAGAVREVAELLGNTPAVARASYVDPRVVEHYENGEVASSERAVRKLLKD